MKKDAFHRRDKETSAGFLALALFLILFPGIASCTIADMFIATAREVESLGETATDVTINTMVSTSQAVESIGKKVTDASYAGGKAIGGATVAIGEAATDATVDTLISTAKALESIGKNFDYVAAPINSAIVTLGEEPSPDNLAGVIVSTTKVVEPAWQAAETTLGEKPEIYGEGRPNLVIGGIRQDSKNPEADSSWILFANDNNAAFIPTYYSGTKDEAAEATKKISVLGGPIIDLANTENAKRLGDGLAVSQAAGGFATYYNGLANLALQEHPYDTIISYSGGTATALAAIDKQGVTCETLILISPMKALLSSHYYADAIRRILDEGFVKNIIVIASPKDEPTKDLDFYQAKRELFGDDKRITIPDVQLTTNGEEAHNEILEYAKKNINHGEFVDPDAAMAGKAAKEEAEKNAPMQSSKSEFAVGVDAENVQEPAEQVKQSENQETSQRSRQNIQEMAQYAEPTTDQSSSSSGENSEGKSLAAEAFAEKYQSTEPSSDIAQGLEPITQAIAASVGESTAESFKKGDRIETTDLLNVRSEPGLPADSSLDTKISAPKSKGSTGTILNDQPVFEDGFTWWEIQYDDGTIGWSQDKRLELDTRDASFGTTLGATSSSGDLPPQKSGSNSESELGGVNFTSIKLNYISMTTDNTGGVNFDLILKAEKANGTKPGIDIQKATRLGATAFLTGLAVPDSKLWVNLNPWEADRIIDYELEESEIGKVMLEADLQMKRDFSNYYNPCANETGKALRSLLEKKSEFLVQRCMNNFPGQIKDASNVFFKPIQRHWIVPDKVYAYSNDSLIYIINASLTINSEPVIDHASFRVENQDISTLSKNCIEELNRSAQEYAEYLNDLEERMIQPYVIADINIGERYEDLREVYAALALAQWYKSKATPNTDIFKDNLDSSSSAILKSQTLWHPKDIWDKYVYSFNNGEYKCWENTTTKTAKGTRTKSLLCSSGGVEFEGIKNHFVKIEAIPPEVQSQAKMAIRDGIVYGRKEVLFGYRLHADQEKENQITGSSLGSSIRSPDLNKRINSPSKENRNVNETDLTSKNIQIQSNETPSAQKASGNLSNVTCPDGWMGPDENGECWQMQIMR